MKDKLINKNLNIQQKKKINNNTKYNDIKINKFSKNSNNTNSYTKQNKNVEDDTEKNNNIKTERNSNDQLNHAHPDLKESTASNKSFCKYIFKNQDIAKTLKKSYTLNDGIDQEKKIEKKDEKEKSFQNINATNTNSNILDNNSINENSKNSSPKHVSKSLATLKKNKKSISEVNMGKSKIQSLNKKETIENINLKRKSNNNDIINKSKLDEISSTKSNNNTIKFDNKLVKINSKMLKNKIKLNPITKSQFQSLSKISSKASLIEIKNSREEYIHSASSFYSTTTTSSSSSSLSSYSKSLNKTQLEIHQRFKKMKQEKLNNIQNNNNINNGNVLNDTEINYEINKSKLKDAKNKKSNIVNLSISTLTGQQFFIKVLSSYTISDVKDLIQEKEGLAAQTQILIYQDKTLDCDSMTIEDYGIENGSSIKLMIKLYDGLCNIEQEDTKKDNTIVLLLCKKKGYLYLFETSLKSTSQLSNESFDSSLFDFYNSFDDKSITSSEMSSKPTSPISTTYSNSSLFNKESLNFLNSQTSKSSVYSSNCDDNISVNNSSKNIMEKKNDKKKVLFNNKSRSLSINYDLLKIIENATLCANKSGYNVTVAIQDLDTPVYSYQSSLNSFSDDDTFTDIYNNKTYKSESISSNSITSSNSSNQISSQINSNAHSKQSTSLSLESSIEYLYNSNSDSNIYVPIYEYNLLSYHSHQTPSLRKTKSEIFNIGQKMQNKNNILTLRKQKSDSQLYKSFMEYLNKTYQPHFHDQINSSNKSTNSILFPCYFLIQDLNRNNSSKSGNITIENKDATSFNKIKSNHKLINFKNNSPSLITPSNTEIRSNTQNSININNIKQNNIHMINTSNSNLTKNDNNKTNNNTKLLSKSYSQVIHPVSQIESSLKQSSFPFIGNKMAGRGVVDGHPQNSKLEETLYTERPSTSVPIVTYYKDIYNPNLIKSSFNIYEDTISNNNNKISLQQEKIDKLEENIEIISINKNFNNAVTIEGNSDIKHISNNGNKQSKKNRNTISLPEISINNSNNKTEKKNPFPKGNIHSFPDIYKHIPNDKIYKPQITIKYKDSDAEDDIDRYVNEENQSYYCPRKENYKYSSNKIKKLEPKIYHKRLSSNQTNYDNKEVFHDTNAIMKKIESEYSINDYSEDEDNIILDYFDQGMNYKELKPEPINSLNNENYHYIPEHELQNLFQKEYINNHNNNYDDEYIYFYDEKDIPFNKIKSFISTKNIKTDIKEKSLDLSFRKKNSDCQNENNKLLASPLSQNNKTNEEINDSSINKSINEALSINNNNNNNNNNMKKKNVCEFCHKKIRITATYKCKCNKIFCATHRYSECHNCTYNYKQNGKKDLEKNNPLVVKDKISKI